MIQAEKVLDYQSLCSNLWHLVEQIKCSLGANPYKFCNVSYLAKTTVLFITELTVMLVLLIFAPCTLRS